MQSPICWPGGKRNLIKRILPLIPEHRIYVEPFCGSAKLFFAKEPSKYEVISDTNGELINFFLVLKYRASALAEKLHSAIAHPHYFAKLKSENKIDDEVDRAFHFAYLNGLSFSGKGEHFGYAFKEPRPKKTCRPSRIAYVT
jgi:DNA adenine methylase